MVRTILEGYRNLFEHIDRLKADGYGNMPVQVAQRALSNLPNIEADARVVENAITVEKGKRREPLRGYTYGFVNKEPGKHGGYIYKFRLHDQYNPRKAKAATKNAKKRAERAAEKHMAELDAQIAPAAELSLNELRRLLHGNEKFEFKLEIEGDEVFFYCPDVEELSGLWEAERKIDESLPPLRICWSIGIDSDRDYTVSSLNDIIPVSTGIEMIHDMTAHVFTRIIFIYSLDRETRLSDYERYLKIKLDYIDNLLFPIRLIAMNESVAGNNEDYDASLLVKWEHYSSLMIDSLNSSTSMRDIKISTHNMGPDTLLKAFFRPEYATFYTERLSNHFYRLKLTNPDSTKEVLVEDVNEYKTSLITLASISRKIYLGELRGIFLARCQRFEKMTEKFFKTFQKPMLELKDVNAIKNRIHQIKYKINNDVELLCFYRGKIFPEGRYFNYLSKVFDIAVTSNSVKQLRHKLAEAKNNFTGRCKQNTVANRVPLGSYCFKIQDNEGFLAVPITVVKTLFFWMGHALSIGLD